jgi:hypothetical protein
MIAWLSSFGACGVAAHQGGSRFQKKYVHFLVRNERERKRKGPGSHNIF